MQNLEIENCENPSIHKNLWIEYYNQWINKHPIYLLQIDWWDCKSPQSSIYKT